MLFETLEFNVNHETLVQWLGTWRSVVVTLGQAVTHLLTTLHSAKRIAGESAANHISAHSEFNSDIITTKKDKMLIRLSVGTLTLTVLLYIYFY